MANGNPEGQYTNVIVHPIQNGQGQLSNGTGTFSSFGMFSCGTFSQDNLPEIDKFYNISGYHNGTKYDFPGWVCKNSGATSDFKDK